MSPPSSLAPVGSVNAKPKPKVIPSWIKDGNLRMLNDHVNHMIIINFYFLINFSLINRMGQSKANKIWLA
jgi:hypothetical protein